jgi:hypothetical protein
MSLCTAGRQPSFPSTAAFGPSARSAIRARLPAYRAPPVAHCQVGAASRHADVIVVILPFSTLADAGAKVRAAPVMAAVATRPAASRRIPAVHVHPALPPL